MTTESIHIPDRQADFIQKTLREGRFENASEMVRAGLQLLEERLAFEQAQKAQLGTMIDKALASGISSKTPQQIWAEVESVG
jgi:putative addiction module CopG family antidote